MLTKYRPLCSHITILSYKIIKKLTIQTTPTSSSKKREYRKSDFTVARILELRFSIFNKKIMKHVQNIDVVVHICDLRSQEAVSELWVSLGYSQTLIPNKTTKTSIQRNNRTKMEKVFTEMSLKKTELFFLIDFKSSILNLFKKVKTTRKVHGDVSPLENYQYVFEISSRASGHIRN